MGCGCHRKGYLRSSRVSSGKSTQFHVIKFSWELGEGCKNQLEEICRKYPQISQLRFFKNKISFRSGMIFDVDAFKEELTSNFLEPEN